MALWYYSVFKLQEISILRAVQTNTAGVIRSAVLAESTRGLFCFSILGSAVCSEKWHRAGSSVIRLTTVVQVEVEGDVVAGLLVVTGSVG